MKSDEADLQKVRDARKDGIIPKAFELQPSNWKDILTGQKLNIVMIISIIPNSFVLSYLAALQEVLATIFRTSPDKEVIINVLFMEDIVISKGGAWESDFVDHYKLMLPECENEEKTRKVLVELKRSEFGSLFNMLLHNFNSNEVKEAVRNGKIEIHFDNLSQERQHKDFGIDMRNGEFTRDQLPIFEFLDGISDDQRNEFYKGGNMPAEIPDHLTHESKSFLDGITGAQRKMFFMGGDRAIILELWWVLDHLVNDSEKGKLIYIATDVFKKSIENCYPNNNLWNRIKDGNIIWFDDPPIRSGVRLVYLNSMSSYINEKNGISYIDLEEFYHNDVLTKLNSDLFKHRLNEMQSKLDISVKGYKKMLNSFFDISDDVDTTSTRLELNIPNLRSHQMDVINKGFLAVQEEVLRSLDLIL